MRSGKVFGLVATVAVIATAIAIYRIPSVRCYLSYAECRASIGFAPEQPWAVPTDPQERAQYDDAHALPTPSQAPRAVPFDFKAARLRNLSGGKSVEQQYFEHLCNTEAVELVLHPVEGVDGLRLLRPRPDSMASAVSADRYGPENPVGFGHYGDANQLDEKYASLPDYYLQPLGGRYRYVEFESPGAPGTVVTWERSTNWQDPRFPHGLDAAWQPANGEALRTPAIVVRRQDAGPLQARYAYTWRGLRHPRDRELGIAGGEFFVVDLQTREVMGYMRLFTSTFSPRHPRQTSWSSPWKCQ